MSIGTAKPTYVELSLAQHHFINNLSIHDTYSVGGFEKEALNALKTIFEKNNVAIMVGGTGLYIRAVCEGLDEFPEVPLSIRREFEDLLEKEGIEFLQKKLQEVDNEYFMQTDIHNSMRLIRALSVWKASGKPFSSFRKGAKTERFFEPIYIYLDVPRAELYERINKRVDGMMTDGLLEEVKKLYPFRNLIALQTVGYSELFDYLDGKMTLDEAVDKIKQHSRNYAKRQITWFRKDAHWQRFESNSFDEILNTICFKIENVNLK